MLSKEVNTPSSVFFTYSLLRSFFSYSHLIFFVSQALLIVLYIVVIIIIIAFIFVHELTRQIIYWESTLEIPQVCWAQRPSSSNTDRHPREFSRPFDLCEARSNYPSSLHFDQTYLTRTYKYKSYQPHLTFNFSLFISPLFHVRTFLTSHFCKATCVASSILCCSRLYMSLSIPNPYSWSRNILTEPFKEREE